MPNDLILIGRRTIQKEAEALAGLVASIDEQFARACEVIFNCQGTILLTGMGKSGLVARKWAATFSGTGTRGYFINPAEAPHGDLGILRKEDVLIALSFSGETAELGYVIRHANDLQIPTIGVTGNPKSSLASQTSLCLSVHLSEEACPLGLAPTTSTTLMMALGDAIAVTLMQMRGFTENDFARLHPGGALGRKLWLRVTELMHHGEELPLLSPCASLDEVLLVMTQKRLGLAIVHENDKVLGVITDGDLRRHFQKNSISAGQSLTAREMMTRNPKGISTEALAVEAREVMEKASIQQLLIYEKDRLVGVVHLHDLLRMKVV